MYVHYVIIREIKRKELQKLFKSTWDVSKELKVQGFDKI